MRDGLRLLVPHVRECFFADTAADFIVYDGTTWGLNKNGVGRGSWAWQRYQCNDLHCPARLGVRIDTLAELFKEAGAR